MSDPNVPPTPPPEPPGPPTPPPAAEPPPPAPGGGGGGGAASQPNTLMLILAYAYLLSVVPLLVEKEDAEIQWHSKHGLVLFGLDIVLIGVFSILSVATGGLLGCVLVFPVLLALTALLVVRIVCIVKAVGGQRFKIPGISQLADSF